MKISRRWQDGLILVAGLAVSLYPSFIHFGLGIDAVAVRVLGVAMAAFAAGALIYPEKEWIEHGIVLFGLWLLLMAFSLHFYGFRKEVAYAQVFVSLGVLILAFSAVLRQQRLTSGPDPSRGQHGGRLT